MLELDLRSVGHWLSIASVLLGIVYYSTLGGFLDGLFLVGVLLFQNQGRSWACLAHQDSAVVNDGWLGSMTVLALISLAVGAGSVVYGGGRSWTTSAPAPAWSSPAPYTGPGRALLFPCTTTHARIFPKSHSFSYSYLVAGLPVAWCGNAGGMVSAGRQSAKGWFHVDPDDYLERGNGHLGLRGKLDAYLSSQDVDPSTYPHAYLVTAARFLGYHFNPVSFWYLYDADKTLAAMILEVNNTFGERRMYFLTPEPSEPQQQQQQQQQGDDVDASSDTGLGATPLLFTQTWLKDFHVSPFNSRKGSYALRASDPLAPHMQGAGPIQATIILRSSHGHGKIVARLFSSSVGTGGLDETAGTVAPAAAVTAWDPAAMTARQKLSFLAAWWWVGLVTFPRIVRQAGLLFFRRRLHVWFRPEPLETNISRLADATERRLEGMFRQYLRHLVEERAHATKVPVPSVSVQYIPSGVPDAAPARFLSPSAGAAAAAAAAAVTRVPGATKTAGSAPEDVEFRVLTPVFYTRFVHYAHDVEAFFCELRESNTIAISRPDLFMQLVVTKAPRPPLQIANPVDFVVFKAIQTLRQRPPRLVQPVTWPRNVYAPAPPPPSSSSSSAAASISTSTSTVTTSGDLRGFRLSAMDGFVLAHQEGSAASRRSYGAAVLTLFLAERTAGGVISLFQAACYVLRMGVAWCVAHGVQHILARGAV
ncbi:hypothetical protein SPI_00867 [Niveomyces insectorum RCEF 264]|uniref:Cyclopropane-fatty-acyl-phospholipid synthase n=1 Tax=Niveomyces insectorum RCEF 264 TaxID=1081102 RepID=A0A162JGL7_9HYPO|nr:hypothetical protein SPI_00867 [Niveomyces insectorum RCEF 264]